MASGELDDGVTARAAPSKADVGPDSGADEEFFAKFDRGMRNLPGESLAIASRVVLHRVSLVVSIGCSIWVGGASAFIVLGDAMQILIWMQSFAATKPCI